MSFSIRPITLLATLNFGSPLFLQILSASVCILASPINVLAEEEMEETSPVIERAVPDPEQARQQALIEEVPQKELVWLDASYPEQSDTQKVLALKQEPRKPNAQGAVLIVPDKGQHADWPGIVRQLRSSLPDSGWFTLSVNLPLLQAPKSVERVLDAKLTDQIALTSELQNQLNLPPKRSEAEAVSAETGANESGASEEETTQQESSQEESTDAAPVDIDLDENKQQSETDLPYPVKAVAHLKAGMDYITSKGYRNIILISIGDSCNVALEYVQPLAQQFKNQGFALIMVDAQLIDEYDEDISVALGEEFQAPVLDLVDGSRRSAKNLYKKRLLMARATNSNRYQQVELASIVSSQENKTLLKRVDTWLQVHAPGMAARKVKK